MYKINKPGIRFKCWEISRVDNNKFKMRKSVRERALKLSYHEESDYDVNEELGIKEEREKVYSKWTREENEGYAKFLVNNIS